jgi:hypothetical protein
MNYDTVTDLGIEVTMQADRAAQMTHGELTITENLTKMFLTTSV